mgnify:CR=1 FL=1
MIRFFNRFSRGNVELDRVGAFSDAIFGIVITILVLQFAVPTLHNPNSIGELANKLVALLPKLVSWFISIVITCKFWINHYYIFKLARKANYALVWINCFFLMSQSFIPFPTALMGEYHENPLAVTLFGVVMAWNTVMYIILHEYINKKLIKPEFENAQDPHIIKKSFIGVFSYLAGAAIAWISVYVGFFIYLITPLLFIVPPRLREDEGVEPPME